MATFDAFGVSVASDADFAGDAVVEDALASFVAG